MHVLLAVDLCIPATKYGGTERIVWWLGKELATLGHSVSYLAPAGSRCDFGRVIPRNPRLSIEDQVPSDVDIVHFHCHWVTPLKHPYLFTLHGNTTAGTTLDLNTVFISRNHAARHNSERFVYNGIDPDEYGCVDFSLERKHLLFLGKASRSKKNLPDCCRIARMAKERLVVVGGRGLSLSRGVSYLGYLGGAQKNRVLNQSKALLFPVLWHEPFGLAIPESLYFGCPVIGTPYGSLPELILPEVGFLSNRLGELVEAVGNLESYDRRACHAYVLDRFTSRRMALDYLDLYARVLDGEPLNPAPPWNPDTKIVRHLPMLE